MTIMTACAALLAACQQRSGKKTADNADTFEWKVDQFADIRILRYQIPEFEQLSLRQKIFLYYLSEAALSGRDIIWDQNCKYNLLVRNYLENIYLTYQGDRQSDNFQQFLIYLKRVWFSNGIHHHYSTDKIQPGFSREFFKQLVDGSDATKFPIWPSSTAQQTFDLMQKILFDPNFLSKRVNLNPSKDLLLTSANNFYENVTQHEAETFYSRMKDPNDPTPVSYGLNSKLVKKEGKIVEQVWKSGGMYGKAIDQIIYWLEKAIPYAENEAQQNVIRLLIKYYRTGDLKVWDQYNIAWVEDTQSLIDFVNGFIEVYGDPLGLKASWEALVNFKNLEATRRTEILSANAQWFEDHSPIDNRFKKQNVKGVSAKVINAVQLGGDLYPATAIGINLPNADWIRKDHGSKSVTLENITYAYDQVSLQSGLYEEFIENKEDLQLIKKYRSLTDNLHTDLHECLGHGSGQLLPGVASDALKNYQSTLEETRADLYALYYIMDEKMVELGILPTSEAAKAQYLYQILNGLMIQLCRIEPGKNLEQAHMRNRQLIARWCYEMGKPDRVIEMYRKNNKTYVRINDYQKLRQLFGQLLAEVQRIKSEGDYAAGKNLVETYGVIVDQKLRNEVAARYQKLNLAPYSGFINPKLVPVEQNGQITEVKVIYPKDYIQQMLEYSEKYSFLPLQN